MNSLFSVLNSLSRIPFGQLFMIARTAKQAERAYPTFERETQRRISLIQEEISSYFEKVTYREQKLYTYQTDGKVVVEAIEEEYTRIIENKNRTIEIQKQRIKTLEESNEDNIGDIFKTGSFHNINGSINVGKDINNTTIDKLYQYFYSTTSIEKIYINGQEVPCDLHLSKAPDLIHKFSEIIEDKIPMVRQQLQNHQNELREKLNDNGTIIINPLTINITINSSQSLEHELNNIIEQCNFNLPKLKEALQHR